MSLQKSSALRPAPSASRRWFHPLLFSALAVRQTGTTQLCTPSSIGTNAMRQAFSSAILRNCAALLEGLQSWWSSPGIDPQ
jgi:hypothetical protein